MYFVCMVFDLTCAAYSKQIQNKSLIDLYSYLATNAILILILGIYSIFSQFPLKLHQDVILTLTLNM